MIGVFSAAVVARFASDPELDQVLFVEALACFDNGFAQDFAERTVGARPSEQRDFVGDCVPQMVVVCGLDAPGASRRQKPLADGALILAAVRKEIVVKGRQPRGGVVTKNAGLAPDHAGLE